MVAYVMTDFFFKSDYLFLMLGWPMKEYSNSTQYFHVTFVILNLIGTSTCMWIQGNTITKPNYMLDITDQV